MTKNIWITGASSGIGKALAEKFARQNWQVAISARRKELLDQIAKNENISSFPLDVTDDKQVKETLVLTYLTTYQVTVLINLNLTF